MTVRFYAFILDWAIRLVIFYAAGMAASAMGGLGFAFWLILLFALEWIYPVAFELTPSGATPGKRTFRLKVVMDDGLPVTAAASVIRNVLRAADFLPLVYGFAIVSMLVRRDCKRLGDIAAGTIVVYDRRDVAPPPIEGIEPVVPAIALTAEDQAAVIALAARAPRLTPSRLDELAAIAAPASGDGGRMGPDVTRRVLGVAQWVLGRR